MRTLEQLGCLLVSFDGLCASIVLVKYIGPGKYGKPLAVRLILSRKDVGGGLKMRTADSDFFAPPSSSHEPDVAFGSSLQVIVQQAFFQNGTVNNFRLRGINPGIGVR